MKIAFNPSTVAALITPPNNKDITFDLRGHNIFARGVKFCGTDTNTWRDIKINNVSIGSNILDLRNGSNTTLTNTNGVVTINSTWRPVVDNLTSDSTTSSLSAKQGKVLKSLIDGKSNLGHNHDDRYLKLTGGTLTGNLIGTAAMFSGRFYGNGDDEGIIVKPSSNGYAGLILGTHNGERSVFYFTKGNPFWRYNNGSTNLDILHPKKSGTIALTSDIPSSLKNPYSLTTFGVVYDGSAAKTVTTSTFISLVTEGTATVTDGTMFITSYASNSGFADTNAVNVPYKRKAIHLWEYIKAKTDSIYAAKSHNHDDRYLKLTGGTMLLGEGLKFHADDNYFGTDLDARIISLLDGNDKVCDGGLIIDERATLDGKEYVTELLRIRDSEFKWRGNNILHSGNTYVNNNKGYINGAEITLVNNSDKVDGYHASSLVKFYLSPMTNDAPADSAKSWFINTMPSASGAIVYNVPGSEKTIIAGKSSGAFGHMLQLNYDNTYLRILRYYNGSWKSTDWEKISAGYADSAGSVAWDNVTGKPSSYTPSAHTHSWTSITDKLVVENEFNIVNAGFKEGMWFNYLPINDRSKTATITGYHFGNGATGYTSIKASGFIKNGSSSSYVLLGDGGHQTISSLSVNHATFADYICSGTLPTPANNTVKAYKDSLAKFFNDIRPNVGVGANVNVSASIINNWSNDSATYYDSSIYCFIKIGGAYWGATYGQFLLSSYNLTKVGIVGRNSSQWSKIKWLAYEDQIPTDNKLLANGAGYITSAGSCAYATSAGNADTVDGLHVHSGRNNEANKIVRTDANGYILAGWINTTSGDMGTTTATRIYCSNDAYIRYKTLANFSSDIAGQLYWANVKVSTSSNAATSPTFGSLWINNSYFFKLSGTTFTCQGGTTFTLPSSNINTSTALLWTTASDGARDTGIFYNSSDFAFIANSNDHGAVFAVYDTDVTQDFEAGASEISVPGNGGALWARGGFSKSGSSNDYVLLGGGGHKAISDFMSSTIKYALSDTIGGNALLAYKLYYPSSPLKDLAGIDNFHEANTFKYALWNGNSEGMGSSFPGTENGIILSGGWAATTYGFQLAIDDDPNYFIALRQRGNGTWSTWKRIPMGDGTGASGTWGINITGNADTVDGYHATSGNNKPWGTIPAITTSGWMDIGNQLEFHFDNTTGSDYSTILRCTGNYSNIVLLPSASGTLALINDVNNYYWANVKISTSSSTTTSPTVHTLTATRVCAGHNPGIDNSISCSNWFRSSGNTGWYNTTYLGGWYMSDTSWIRAHNGVGIYTSGQIYSSSSIRMSNILLEHTDEINNSANGGIHLNYRNSGNVSLCYGGGNVGIGTTTPSYKLDVNGLMRADGFHHYYADSNNYVLLAGGGYGSLFTNTSYNYTDNSKYNLTFHKLGSIFNNLVWVDGHVYGSTSTQFIVNSNVWAYKYDNSSGLDTTYSMGGNDYISVDAAGVVLIRCNSPHRVGFFYTGKA